MAVERAAGRGHARSLATRGPWPENAQVLVILGLRLVELAQTRAGGTRSASVHAARLAQDGQVRVDADGGSRLELPAPRAWAPAERATVQQELLDGPYAQRLYALFGRPSVVRWDPDKTDALGTYGSTDDELVLSSHPGHIQSAAAARAILAHEMIHRWQAQRGHDLGELWEAHAVPRPAATVQTYARVTRAEQQAEAGSAAIGLLDLAARREVSDGLVAATLKQLEALTPGTVLMVRVLRAHPAYQGHAIAERALAPYDLEPLAAPGLWASRAAEGQDRLGRSLQSVSAGLQGPAGRLARMVGRLGLVGVAPSGPRPSR